MIYGARLRQAREMALTTQAELARETGVPQSLLSRAESDSYDLGEERLALVAEHLDFPSRFFESSPLADFGQRPVHFRAQASMSMKLADQATRTGEVVTDAVQRMQRFYEGPELRLPIGESEPDAAASHMRVLLGLAPSEAAIGLPSMLEHIGVVVVGLPLAAHKRDAFSLWAADRPVLALLDTDAGDRQLWSTAHELGHLLLHRDSPANRELEAAADEFAMHLLIPPLVLDEQMPMQPTMRDFALLKRRWGVSIAALIRMARRLDRIDQAQYTSLFKQMSARGERLRERTYVAPVKPRGLRAMAELRFGAQLVDGLADENSWSLAFAEKVVSRHARADELPWRSGRRLVEDNVVSIAQARPRARGRSMPRSR